VPIGTFRRRDDGRHRPFGRGGRVGGLSRLESVQMGMVWRRRAGLAAIGAALVTGTAAAPAYGPLVTVPAAVAWAALIGVFVIWAADRRRLAVLGGAAGAVSLAATAGALLVGEPQSAGSAASGWGLAESAALMVLIALVVRGAPVRLAPTAAVLAGAAAPVVLLRFGIGLITLVGSLAWGLGVVLAVAVGLYLRSLDDRRARSVDAARRTQRLQLAQDLHDFVAHDVSEMLAQAQAGQILAAQDPGQATAAFRRIEQAALQALASMDRTVRMLHEADDSAAGRTPLPGIADLPELADRFSAGGTAAIQLDIDPRLDEPAVPREVGTAAYRVVVEALTNIRRHAPAAREVRVTLRRTRPGLEITVTDDARPEVTRIPGPTRRRGGLGLPGLTEGVQALGGTLTAGPRDPCGWRVAAVLPLPVAS
jgi:signal transduction histidine kinase